MNPQNIQALIDTLSRSLSGPSAQVWRVALSYNSGCAWWDLVMVAVALAISVAAWRVHLHQWDKDDGYYYREMPGWTCIAVALWVFAFILAATYGEDAFFRLTQPQWMAAQDIIGSILTGGKS